MPTDAPEAFISYAREDSDFALRLVRDLRAVGAKLWIDQLDIPPSQRWDRAISDALSSCPRILVILSPDAVDSENVLDEIDFALGKEKAIIPILYRDCEVPFRLRRVQYIDFRSEYVSGRGELIKALALSLPPAEQKDAEKPLALRARFFPKSSLWRKVAVACSGVLILAWISWWMWTLRPTRKIGKWTAIKNPSFSIMVSPEIIQSVNGELPRSVILEVFEKSCDDRNGINLSEASTPYSIHITGSGLFADSIGVSRCVISTSVSIGPDAEFGTYQILVLDGDKRPVASSEIVLHK